MAAQFESPNQVQEILRILWKRKWQILLPLLYGLTIGMAVAAFLPRKYKAVAQVNVFETRVEASPFRADPQAASGAREVQNANYQLRQDNRIRRILEDLAWPEYLQLTDYEKWDFRERIRRNLGVYVLPKARNEGSTFIDITFVDSDPGRAERFLRELSHRWVFEVYQRDLENRRREMEVIKQQLDRVREDYRAEQAQFGARLLESGIDFAELTGTGSRGAPPVNPLVQRISESERALERTEAELAGVEEEIRFLREARDREPEFLSGDVLGGEVNLGEQIAGITLQIQALRIDQERFRSETPRWSRKEEQIRLLEDRIQQLRGVERQGSPMEMAQPNPRRVQLVGDIQALEVRQASLRAARNAIGVRLDSDRADLRRRTDARLELNEMLSGLERRYENLSALERKYTDQGNIIDILDRATQLYEITQEARAERTPVEPNVPVVIGIGAGVGLALGLALALLFEFLQPGFRLPSDAARALTVPVLGVVEEVPTRASRRARLVQRSLVTAASVLLLGGIHWFVFTWQNHPERLGTDVVQAIEDLRTQMR